MAITKEEVVNYISNISVLELSELVKEFETKFGVSAAAPVAVAGAASGAAAGAAAAEEKTAFTLTLEAAGDKKIDVIKVVRQITNLGLKEAKDLVEGAPKQVKDGITKEEVEKYKKDLEAVGAKVKVS